MGQLDLNFLTFPLWWYTVGAGIVWEWAKRKTRYSLSQTGILLFARHWNEPLYGDYTKAGVIISFFLRIFLLIWKSITFSIRMLLISIAGLIYLAILPAVLIMVIYQIFPT